MALYASSAMKLPRGLPAVERSTDDMQQRPDLNGLPTVIEHSLRKWVDAIEMTSTGMGSVVETEAQIASASLKRRVDLTPPMEAALAQALEASIELARMIDTRSPTIDQRAAVLAALSALVVALRDARPSDSTLALGLGW